MDAFFQTCSCFGTLMVGAGSRAATVTFHRVVDTELNTGIFLVGIMFSTLAKSVMCYGKLDMGRTDYKDTFPDQGGLAGKSERFVTEPGGSSFGDWHHWQDVCIHQASSESKIFWGRIHNDPHSGPPDTWILCMEVVVETDAVTHPTSTVQPCIVCEESMRGLNRGRVAQ